MNRMTTVPAFLVACLALSCSSANTYTGAEDITYGTWSGTFTPSGAETIDISYLIHQEQAKQSGRALFGNTGHVLLPSSEQVEMTDLEWDGTTLVYSWIDPEGTRLSCALVKQSDTLLSGDCLDSNGGISAQMTMTPPAGKLGST